MAPREVYWSRLRSALREAELVALGIGQHDVSLFRELADIDVTGTELERRRDGVLLVGGTGAGQVEVRPTNHRMSADVRATRG